MDIYVKKAIIHQFSPSDTDLLLADKYLNITPKIEEYLRYYKRPFRNFYHYCQSLERGIFGKRKSENQRFDFCSI